MSKMCLQPAGHLPPRPPYSSVVVSDGLVFVSGQAGLTPDGVLVGEDFERQAVQTFDNLAACLTAAGCSFDDVLKVTAYLVDGDDFDAFNTLYRERFPTTQPARTTVLSGLLMGFRVELDAIARVPSGGRGTERGAA
jgi:2-iminobutanoate/2-iminopropanoate deaminase